ncbi:MAG TPA: two-component regulator propeller domain-containing protein [Verrucomicrobiae bacterium]|jgi:ligand-binding sensor domain-containing protein/signal transduction histidine kinase|nr:two-component regulator propeller domain-containing protein [Verrucomicrobiae bacterium]
MLKNRWMLAFAWLWLCVFFVAVPMMGGAADSSGSPFIIHSWSNKEGLPDGEVISAIQTKDGYLWLGTLHGLVRFDGNRFAIFDENNTPGLGGDRIVYLFEDSHTNLWVGTESAGFAMITNGVIRNFGTQNGGGKIIYAAENSSGVWFHTAEGLFNYHDGKMNFYAGAISTELLLLEGWAIIPSRTGGYWKLLNGTVEKMAGGRLIKNLGTSPWGNVKITSACEDDDGNLIVGTLGKGVFWYEPDGKYRQISKAQGLSSDFVLSLCLDRGGNLWVGTDGDGLNQIKRKIFSTPTELQMLAAQSVSEDDHGGLWTAFNAHGVSYWLTNSAQDFGVSRNQSAWSVLVDHRQQVWVGTLDEGLFQFQTNHFIPAPGAEILGQQIFALFETRGGQLWAGTQNGLARWDGQNWKMFTARDGLSENVVRAIAEDAEGNLWVGTENHGLNFFKDGKFISYHAQDNGLPGDNISCLYADKNGVLWVGTAGHGLARFQNGKWTRYSTENGLASDSISYLIEDDAGYLWIGSNMGLMRIQKKSLNDFADETTNSISCRTFTETDGLPTRECTAGSQPAAIRAHDGTLWFPTTKGLVSVNPAELKPNLQPPVVMIESVKVDGHEQKTNALSSTWSQAVVVPPGREQLEIDYTALNFSAPDAVRFKYRLEGRDNTWTDARAERVANYSNLSPGHYQFHVVAFNEDGVPNETGGVLDITVQPQFWQTNWFRAAGILCLIGIVVGVVRYISTQKLKRALQLHKQHEELERERARIARDLHDQLGANLTQVALLGEMAEADKNLPGEIELHAQQISHTARETTRSLDEIVWAVNPSNDTLEGLANYVCKYAQEYLALAGIRYRADVPAHLPATDIPPEVRHNVFLAFKESVNNVVKHAQASEAWIRLRLLPENFILEIEDNGHGPGDIDSKAAQMRNGLRNMKKRMEDIRGEFSIASGANGGTIVRLTIPIILTTDKHG